MFTQTRSPETINGHFINTEWIEHDFAILSSQNYWTAEAAESFTYFEFYKTVTLSLAPWHCEELDCLECRGMKAWTASEDDFTDWVGSDEDEYEFKKFEIVGFAMNDDGGQVEMIVRTQIAD